MAGKIVIDSERCKGCGLCVGACRRGCIEISTQSNCKGYFPVQVFDDRGCTGCGLCAVVCPDVAIEVFRDDDLTIGSELPPRKTLLIRGTT